MPFDDLVTKRPPSVPSTALAVNGGIRRTQSEDINSQAQRVPNLRRWTFSARVRSVVFCQVRIRSGPDLRQSNRVQPTHHQALDLGGWRGGYRWKISPVLTSPSVQPQNWGRVTARHTARPVRDSSNSKQLDWCSLEGPRRFEMSRLSSGHGDGPAPPCTSAQSTPNYGSAAVRERDEHRSPPPVSRRQAVEQASPL